MDQGGRAPFALRCSKDLVEERLFAMREQAVCLDAGDIKC
jgi:hypothetical protein